MTTRQFLKTCRTGTADTVENLLKAIPEAWELRTKADETPLHLAIAHNSHAPAVVNLLLQNGHDPNARGFKTQNKAPLHEAARRGCLGSAKALLMHGARVDAVKQGDWTPAMVACVNAHDAIVRLLVSCGADLGAVNRLGETVLHLSARSCHACLEICIKNGANVATRSRNGKTGLHYAAHAGNMKCARMLIEEGCGVKERDDAGVNCVVEACINGHCGMVRDLMEIDRSAVWIGDCGGFNGLHHAAINGHDDLVELLLKESPDRVDEEDNRGCTATRLALLNGREKVVRLLMDAGARVEQTWVDECRRLKRNDCAEIVEEYRGVR